MNFANTSPRLAISGVFHMCMKYDRLYMDHAAISGGWWSMDMISFYRLRMLTHVIVYNPPMWCRAIRQDWLKNNTHREIERWAVFAAVKVTSRSKVKSLIQTRCLSTTAIDSDPGWISLTDVIVIIAGWYTPTFCCVATWLQMLHVFY